VHKPRLLNSNWPMQATYQILRLPHLRTEAARLRGHNKAHRAREQQRRPYTWQGHSAAPLDRHACAPPMYVPLLKLQGNHGDPVRCCDTQATLLLLMVVRTHNEKQWPGGVCEGEATEFYQLRRPK